MVWLWLEWAIQSSVLLYADTVRHGIVHDPKGNCNACRISLVKINAKHKAQMDPSEVRALWHQWECTTTYTNLHGRFVGRLVAGDVEAVVGDTLERNSPLV